MLGAIPKIAPQYNLTILAGDRIPLAPVQLFKKLEELWVEGALTR
jgi:hypothetical protein